MRKEVTVPVYLITGFLDAGKSNFLQFTMQEDYFNDGSRSLLILCEEGEDEYTEEMLKKTRTQMVVIEDKEELTPEYFEELKKKYKPERVLIEYNGMWSVPDILNTAMPSNWQFYQVITICDGENFKLYLNNIKNMAMDLFRNTDMVIFNRCDPESEDLTLYQRSVRSVNQRCTLVFEGKDGQEIEPPEPDLPYSLDTDPIEVTDENWATFYIDLSEHPERYDGKRVHFLIQAMMNKKYPDGLFVGGRRAMTCCVEDIRFLPYIFIYEKAKTLANRTWTDVVCEIKWEYHKLYQEEGPVFYVQDLKVVTGPAEEVVSF